MVVKIEKKKDQQNIVISVKDILPNKRNSRLHSQEQVSAVVASIEEFGLTKPIIVDEDNVILAGHCVYKACQVLEWESVSCIRISHLSEFQKKAYVIADNQLATLSNWDNDILQEEIIELKDEDFDLSLLGFGEDSLTNLLEAGSDEFFTDPDEIPDVSEKVITKLGDIWLLGNHRVMCGDSTKKKEVDRLLDGVNIDMVLTDPPYGVGYNYNLYKDTTDCKEHEGFLADLIMNALSFSCRFILFTGSTNIDLITKNSKPSHIGCWVKMNALSSGNIVHFMTWEPIFFWGKWPKKRANNVFNYTIGPQKGVGGHTCPKPLLLCRDIIKNFSERKQYILDLFIGSGTTLIACECLSRICYGMELDPHYCDVIVKRWEGLTGKKAVLEGQG